jgi:hypothetical protein
MHRVLNVAEKNDAAKSLARLLANNSARMVTNAMVILDRTKTMSCLSLA